MLLPGDSVTLLVIESCYYYIEYDKLTDIIKTVKYIISTKQKCSFEMSRETFEMLSNMMINKYEGDTDFKIHTVSLEDKHKLDTIMFALELI